MIRFVEKFFSIKLDYHIEPICVEIIKLLEFWFSFTDSKSNHGVNTEHWIENLSGLLLKCSDTKVHPQNFFVLFETNTSNVPSSLSECYNLAKYRGSELIEHILTIVITARSHGQNKYKRQIDIQGGFSHDPDTYRLIIKYISLCLSGQLSEEDCYIWENLHKIERMNVDYKKRCNYNKDSLKKKLSKIFVAILEHNDFI